MKKFSQKLFPSLFKKKQGNILASLSKKGIFSLLFFFLFTVQALYAQWDELGGLNGLAATDYIHSICKDVSGNIYATGQFTNSSGKFYVARWNGTAWSELGGLNSLAANFYIKSMCTDASGNVYVGGSFKNSLNKYYVAKWSVSTGTWSELGGLNALSANGAIFAVHADGAGNIYAGGFFTNSSAKKYVAKWNGTVWSEVGGLNALSANGSIKTICSDPSGNIYAGGDFTNASGNVYVAKWNGTSWNELAGLYIQAANNSISSVCSDISGNIYTTGNIRNASSKCYVGKWNGTAWSEVGTSSLNANGSSGVVCTDASGNIYTAGSFTNTLGKYYVAKWNGTTWGELGGLGTLAANSWINSVCVDAAGNVYAAGTFTNASGNRYVSMYNNLITAGLSIALSQGSNPSCQGSSVTFTASPVNGGTAPAYQWKINGANVGTNSATYTTTTLTNGQIVSCEMTSNLAGVQGNPATSNSIQISISTAGAPTVNITTTSPSTICPSWDAIYFNAIGNNTSGSTTYVWKNNGNIIQGSLVNGPSFGTWFPNSGSYIITCEMTTNTACGSPTTVVSNAITINVIQTQPSITITSNATSVCQGAPVTFTANITNFGSSWGYKWKVDGIASGSNSFQFTSSSLSNGQVVTCDFESYSNCPVVASPDGIIGGTNFVSGTLGEPYGTATASDKQEFLIHASELINSGLTAGEITSLSFYLSNTAGSPYVMSNYYINMASTTLSDIPAFSFVPSVFTKVYGPVNYSPIVNSKNTHNFSTPFYWDGVSNLVIDICHQSFTSGSVTYKAYQNFTTGYNSVAKSTVSNSSAPCFDISASSGGAQRPLMTFSEYPLKTASSNSIVMSVTPSVVPSISIATNATTSCSGNPVTFTASAVNGGTAPIYQWKVNGVNAGTNSATFTTSSLINGQVVTCSLTSNAACASSITATSNSIAISISTSVVPVINISSDVTNIFSGEPVNFTSSIGNGGTAPTYQWKINGVNAVQNGTNLGTNNSSFSTVGLTNGQTVSCVLTSNSNCVISPTATSNTIGISVQTSPWVAPGAPNYVGNSPSRPFNAMCRDYAGFIYLAKTDYPQSTIWKWNGSSWSTLALGYNTALTTNWEIRSICVDAFGNAYAAGQFTNSSGKYYVAKWDAVAHTWSELGGVNGLGANNIINTICLGEYINGQSSQEIYAAGYFTNASGKYYVAKWNGFSWSEAGTLNANSWINSIVYKSGVLCAAGAFTNSSGKAYVAKWSGGSTWSELGGLNGLVGNSTNISSICFGPSNLQLYAAVGFVAKYDNTLNIWSELGGLNSMAINGPIYSINTDANGNVYAGGAFTNSNGKGYVTKYDIGLGTWGGELGGLNTLHANHPIYSVCTDATGNVYAAGAFTDGVNYNEGQVYMAKYSTPAAIASVSIGLISGTNPSCSGNSITFTATPINGGTAPTYQWKVDGVNVGTNSPSYTTTTLTSGQFISCVMTSNLSGVSGNPATSNSITITVTPLPTATISSASTTVCQGSNITLSANIGTGLSYQWKLNTIIISGATAATYTTNAAGTYTCTVTNACGSVTSNAIQVTNSPPTVSIINTSSYACTGNSVLLGTSITNGGTSPSYQWNLNGTAISGATSSSYSANQTGDYSVFVTNTQNGCNSLSSSQNVTIFNGIPSTPIASMPYGPLCNAVFLGLDTGSIKTGYTYQWKLNGMNISGANGTNYVSYVKGTFSCAVTNSCGTSTSNSIIGNILGTGNITYVGSTSFCSGNLMLTAPTGIEPNASYQWYLGNYQIEGANNSNYNATGSGTYKCEIATKTCNKMFTTNSITIDGPPSIVAEGPLNICVGGVKLDVFSGTSTTSYQWKLNGNPISGATGTTYTATTSGLYTCETVNTVCGTKSSNSLTVAVGVATPIVVNDAYASGLMIDNCLLGGSGAAQITVIPANMGTYTLKEYTQYTNVLSQNSNIFSAPQTGYYFVELNNGCATSQSYPFSIRNTSSMFAHHVYTSNGQTSFCDPSFPPTLGVIQSGPNSNMTPTWNTYLWRLNGASIGTSPSINASQTGWYTCRMTNSCGSTAWADSLYISISHAPTIPIVSASGPLSFCQGKSVTFSINPVANAYYTWRRNGTNVASGSNVTSYTASIAGTYTVEISVSPCALVTSASQVVSITIPFTPVITSSGPTSLCIGQSVTLETVNGVGYSYVWYLNGLAISGASSFNYLANSSGSYFVKVTDAAGCSNTSAAINVTQVPLPIAAITSPSTSMCAGTSVVLSANTGTGLSYQWKLNTSAISGATAATYAATAAGSYTCTVTNSCGNVTSNAITISLNPLPAAAITAPSASFCTGGSVTLSANTGTGLSYQWNINNGTISGATAASYTTTTVGSFTCTVTNACGNATSNVLAITVNPLPTASITSPTTTVCSGGSIVLTANTGTGYSYQWKKSNVAISGATSSTYVATASGTYSCTIANACGNSTSNTITITAAALPTATITAAGSTSFCSGGSVTLNAPLVSGYTYQWKVNGVSVVGATASTYVATVAGTHKCTITNSCGSVTSNIITITINAPNATISASGATTFCGGGSVVLSAPTQSGVSYVWKKDGTTITGATVASYTATTNGNYKCIATNSCGSTTSNIIMVIAGKPAKSTKITGSGGVCPSALQTYSAAVVPTASSYIWTVPSGASITAGQGTSAITVQYGTTITAGNISCVATNVCGNGTAKTLAISKSATCGIARFAEQKEEDFHATKIRVFPNPSENGIFTIAFENAVVQKISVFDLLGKKVYEDEDVNSTGNYTLRLIDLTKGVYVLKIQGIDINQVIRIQK